MSAPTDAELLAACRARADRGAMELLVRRHIGFVYASALRQVRNVHLAEDITQAVFIILSNKACTIRSDLMLRDWLFVTTRYAVKNALRSEARRRYHERIAAARRSERVEDDQQSLLEELSPLLDEGIAQLRESDRRGILMSYFDGLPLREVGRAWGVSEDAARKRLARAIERLRIFFASRGVEVGSVKLTNALHHAAIASNIAPATLVASTIAMSGSGSALAIAKGAGSIMTWMKIKSVAAAIAISCATTGAVVSVAMMNVGPGEAHAAAWASEDRAKPQAAGGMPVARFADGMSIEVLGVAHVEDGKWYSAGGVPIDEQCDFDTAMSGPTHFICVRVDKLPDGANVVWKASANTWAANPARKAGVEVPGLFVLSCRATNQPLDLECKIATGEWLTLAECKATGTMCRPFDQGSVAFAPMYEQDGGTCASIAHDITGHQVRVQAIDGDGTAHPAVVRVINSPGKLVQMNLFFPLPMDKIDKVEFQIRPFDHIARFKGIAMDPAAPSEVKVEKE